MPERAQTAVDYLIGIIVFLLTVVAVFGFFPTLFQPFEEPVGDEEQVITDKLGNELIEANALRNRQRTLNFSSLDETLTDDDEVRERSGMPDWRQWNVTVQNDDDVINNYGDTLRRGAEATSVRYVRLDNHPADRCQDGCQIIVRVW